MPEPAADWMGEWEGVRYRGQRSGVVGVMRVVGCSYKRKEKMKKMNGGGKRAGKNQRELR